MHLQTASLGTYEVESDAARAYDRAHYEMYGRLDLLNFPADVEGEADVPEDPVAAGVPACICMVLITQPFVPRHLHAPQRHQSRM